MIKRVTIYCASSDKVDQKYFEATQKLAKIFVENDIETVFGGGAKGLMGTLASTVIEEGGKIQGIMPRFMKEVEWQHPLVKDFIFTEDMAERKHLLIQNVDAIVALPGGCGTLEELIEVVTLKRLGKFTKPVIVFNQDGFYQSLIDLFDKWIDESFMREEHKNLWTIASKVEDILPCIRNAPPWDEKAINFAAV